MTFRPLPRQPGVPWWAQVSAVVGPAVLVAGWLLTDHVDVGDEDLTGWGLSDLAMEPGWWVTAAAVTVAGVAYILTAAGLRPADPGGRGLLAAGGVLTLLSGWSPALGRPGFWHSAIANVALVTLCVWPALMSPDRPDLPGALGRRFGGSLATALGALFVLYVIAGMDVQEATFGPQHRLLMTAQALAPLLVILGVQLRPAALRRPASQP